MNKFRLTATLALIIINVVVFFVGKMTEHTVLIQGYQGAETTTINIFDIIASYSWFTCFQEWQLWRLISYQFVHATPWHLAFNMWALYIFGPAVEEFFGARRFLGFYLTCGVAGALFSSLLAGLGIYYSEAPWQMVRLVGASASIYGVMVAVAFLYPHVRVSLLFPPVTMTMRTFAMVVIGIATVVILFNGGNAGGEAGHLGGIIMGAAIMAFLKRRYRF